jgi:hypothetical protein
MTAIKVRSVIVGVDTHKHMHVAVALSDQGVRLGQLMIAAEHGGYEQLLEWAQAFGRVERFGIEGTGSYGPGLTSYLRRHAGRGERRSVSACRPGDRDTSPSGGHQRDPASDQNRERHRCESPHGGDHHAQDVDRDRPG